MLKVIMFTGPSCSACRVMKPIIAKHDHVEVLDVTEAHNEVAQYRIRGGLPVFIKLHNDEYLDRQSGVMPAKEFDTWATSK